MNLPNAPIAQEGFFAAHWGSARFNYEAASDQFTADPQNPSDCGSTYHTAVKAKDYIFHPYQKR